MNYIPLQPGDKVVSTVNHRDNILIFTERGDVFVMKFDESLCTFVISKV